MIAYIVCEGKFDTELLQKVLPPELLHEVELVAANGLSSAKSLARSLVVRRQVPVAIVADADTVSSELVQERLKSIEGLVTSVSANVPVKVILAVPSIEAVFFQDPLLLSRLGYESTPEIISLATFQPKQALQVLLTKSTDLQLNNHLNQLINQLDSNDIPLLRKAPFFLEIIEFLQSLQETAKAS